jgi:hypothetical protein
MQKVVGSSPISRLEDPANRHLSRIAGRLRRTQKVRGSIAVCQPWQCACTQGGSGRVKRTLSARRSGFPEPGDDWGTEPSASNDRRSDRGPGWGRCRTAVDHARCQQRASAQRRAGRLRVVQGGRVRATGAGARICMESRRRSVLQSARTRDAAVVAPTRVPRRKCGPGTPTQRSRRHLKARRARRPLQARLGCRCACKRQSDCRVG